MKNQYEIDYQQGYDTANDEWLDRIDKIRTDIENEVKFWSEPSKFNVESVVNARKAKVQSYKHCLEIIDNYKPESELGMNESNN